MKSIFTLLIGIVFSLTILNSQDAPPQAFSYKATITKTLPNGNIVVLPNKTIGLKISILKGDPGTEVYSETFYPTTNPSGQIDIVIGLHPDIGSPLFSSIPWSEGIFSLLVYVDLNGGTAFGETPMSSTQLLSVPYALYADKALNVVNRTVPGGANGQVQFNKSGAFGGDANFFWDNTSKRLGLGTSILYAPLTVRTADNTGIYIESTSSNGVGIEGKGNLYGIFGILNSDNGSAIYGLSQSATGNTNGVFGVSESPNSGVGVKGIASSRSGSNFGVYGASFSSIGIGIYGVNESASGRSTGIVGQVSSSEGTAIKGQALSSSGITYGIKGTVMSPDGYSGYFFGGKFCVFGNVGLGNINPNFELDVAGDINFTGNLRKNGELFSFDYNNLINKPTGNNVGDIQYWNGTSWAILSAGKPGQVLTMGPPGIPVWQDLSNQPIIVTGIIVTGAGEATTITTDNGTLQLNTAITPTNASNQTVTWSLTNGSGVATISTSGLVTAVSNGTVTATATANDGSGISGSLVINLSNQIAYSIGDIYQGGIIFYIDGSGEHGLICAPSDQSYWNAEWGCELNDITGADGTAVGTGYANTVNIIAGCSALGIAALICNDFELEGYTEWYLPSKDELVLMYNNLWKDKNIGNLGGGVYWSSSEYESSHGTAGALDFRSGSWYDNFYKASKLSVRAIRSF